MIIRQQQKAGDCRRGEGRCWKDEALHRTFPFSCLPLEGPQKSTKNREQQTQSWQKAKSARLQQTRGAREVKKVSLKRWGIAPHPALPPPRITRRKERGKSKSVFWMLGQGSRVQWGVEPIKRCYQLIQLLSGRLPWLHASLLNAGSAEWKPHPQTSDCDVSSDLLPDCFSSF